MMVVTEASVIYPVVVVKGNNITCRALLDTDAATFCASSALPDALEPFWFVSEEMLFEDYHITLFV